MSREQEETIVIDDSDEDSDVEFVETVNKTEVDEDCIIIEDIPTTRQVGVAVSTKRSRNETHYDGRKTKRINTQNSMNTQTEPPLPVINYTSCSVCYEHFSQELHFYSTLCGHLYCQGCIEKVMTLNKLCAVCRKKLTKKQYHRIFPS